MEVETQTKQAQKQLPSPLSTDQPSSLTKIIFVASIAAGIQFGWALQLSLLTPYVQLLGIPHTWAAFIWLCGPISGMLVQPIVGYYSDRCTSRFGRRRPFIVAGAALVATAVFLIGFAADMGHAFGDSLEKKTKPRAVAIFVVGFWILDVANNMLQGPCRALLADLSGDDQKKMRTANAFFSFFMAVGNVLGYAAGSYKHLYKIFSFTKTKACDVYCANLKSCFFISITLLLTLTAIGLACVKEKIQTELAKERGENENDKSSSSTMLPFFGEILGAFKELQRPMWILLLVTCLNWIGWFPFLLFDTDWMGKEVYGGKVGDGPLYDMGVRAGSLGLMLNSVVLGFMSLGIAFLAKRLGGIKRVWGIGNIVLAICMALTVLITKLAESHRHGHPGINSPPPTGVKVGALALFSVLGIPLAEGAKDYGIYGRYYYGVNISMDKVTYTIPFALASIFSSTSGAGQGLSLGVLNISICIPQMIVSVLSGPWDALFGGGNLAAFVVGGLAAAVSGILALTLLPSPPSQLSNSKDIPVGFH